MLVNLWQGAEHAREEIHEDRSPHDDDRAAKSASLSATQAPIRRVSVQSILH